MADLPGVGWSLREQLHGMGILTVADVRKRSCAWLQQEVGHKKGLKLWEAAHGKDDRCVFCRSSACLAVALHSFACLCLVLCFSMGLRLVVSLSEKLQANYAMCAMLHKGRLT